MIKVIVNLNVSIKRVALVSLSLPLGLYGVFLAQPKVTSAHNMASQHRSRWSLDLVSLSAFCGVIRPSYGQSIN